MIEQKLRKLLNVAEKAATEEEAQTFLAKAQALATEHAIDLALIHGKDASRATTITSVTVNLPGKRSLDADFSQLLAFLCEANDVSVIRSTQEGCCLLYGAESDLSVVQALFATATVTMVRLTEEHLAAGEWRKEEVWRNKSPHGYGLWPQTRQSAGTSFRLGFASGLREKLQKAREDAVAASSGTDLVLIDKAAQAEKAMRVDNPRIRRGRSRTIRSERSYRAGQQAGAQFGSAGIGQARQLTH